MSILPPKPRKQWSLDELDELEARVKNVEALLEARAKQTHETHDVTAPEIERRPARVSPAALGGQIHMDVPASINGLDGQARITLSHPDHIIALIGIAEPSGRLVLEQLTAGRCEFLEHAVPIVNAGALLNRVRDGGFGCLVELFISNPTLAVVPVTVDAWGWPWPYQGSKLSSAPKGA
jgi:hypothetical protein